MAQALSQAQKMLDGKTPDEQLQYARNMLKERGMTEEDIKKKASDLGIKI
jgi:hypothetical protein